MAVVAKRTVMTLYSDLTDPYSHQVRIVLAEKGVCFDIIQVKPNQVSEALLEINPYGSVPTLVDRDLVLWDARNIMEYLDERFPHPPLLPVYPVARAESRKMMYRIRRDWYTLMHTIYDGSAAEAKDARQHLRDSLISLDPIFSDKPYFLSEDFSMLDCYLAPLFWRLPQMEIEIPASCKGIHKYIERVFSRDSFQTSLTEVEREMRDAA